MSLRDHVRRVKFPTALPSLRHPLPQSTQSLVVVVADVDSDQLRQLSTSRPGHFPGTVPSSTMTMFDFLSLSVFQLLSILSFVTSVLAILRMGTGSFHRLSPKFETSTVPQASAVMTAARQWSWSSLPSSFSLNALIGEDEEVKDTEKDLSGYSAGAELVRMDWRSDKPFSGMHVCSCRPTPRSDSPPVSPVPYSQPPLSMAKLIMARHVSCIFFLASVDRCLTLK